ncbi:alpha carbonic anhydrase 1, chloroplastic [Daucus carota subsp. sativus]|uniref:alpha carbonic anhydrase 1, chloroplastic n=1 Tax=Daucus carota subsp. sativus TaxID=79200 RepID=UPI0030838081
MELSLLAIAISAFIVTTQAAPGADNIIEFSYSGAKGPDKWGSLDPKFKTCSDGKAQSPINILHSKAAQGTNMTLNRKYIPATATLVNNGFNVGIHFEENAGVIGVDGKDYRLQQIHWRTPSEHNINGKAYDAELQLLHKADDGSIFMGAILYQIGNGDIVLTKIHRKLEELGREKCGGDEHARIDLGKLDPNPLRKCTRRYFRYQGSFTTPPCTENVIWHVFEKVRTISKQQLELLKAPMLPAFKSNSRPVQPDNGRQVVLNYDQRMKS